MNTMTYRTLTTLLGIGLLTASGCAERTGTTGASRAPAVEIASASRGVVEEYLQAAAKADGARMYALLATSERRDETPDSLRKTAADRYSAEITWEIEGVNEQANSSTVVALIRGAKDVEPNPYRFTLTKEGGEWRIVQSPELHEDDDDIKIKIE